jgi:H+/Cl- antiporter ClcA
MSAPTFIAAITNKPDLSVLLENLPAGTILPQWNVSDPTIARVLFILRLSLATSFLAVFIALLGKLLLRHYAQAGTHASIVDRARDRQRKMNRMITWRFDLVMRWLFLVPVIGLLLFFYALYDYFSFVVDKAGVSQVTRIIAFIFFFILVAIVIPISLPDTPPSDT